MVPISAGQASLQDAHAVQPHVQATAWKEPPNQNSTSLPAPQGQTEPKASGEPGARERTPVNSGSAPEKGDSPPVLLRLAGIRVDTTIQSRERLSKSRVAVYAERMKEGDKFPPVAVFEIEGVKFLVDGFLRLAAAQQIGEASIGAAVYRGSRADAIKFAIEANVCHGLGFSGKEKRKAVELVLSACGGTLSNRAIADPCKVTHPTVAKVRKLVNFTSCQGEERLGLDRKKRKMPRKQSMKTPSEHSDREPDPEVENTEPTPSQGVG